MIHVVSTMVLSFTCARALIGTSAKTPTRKDRTANASIFIVIFSFFPRGRSNRRWRPGTNCKLHTDCLKLDFLENARTAAAMLTARNGGRQILPGYFCLPLQSLLADIVPSDDRTPPQAAVRIVHGEGSARSFGYLVIATSWNTAQPTAVVTPLLCAQTFST